MRRFSILAGILASLVVGGVATVANAGPILGIPGGDSTAASWGENGFGDLGDGTTVTRTKPVLINGGTALDGKDTDFAELGILFGCSLTEGKVYCWGHNDQGQLGNGTTVDSLSPVQVKGLLANKTVVQVEVGGKHACALTTGGQLYCWGSNQSGQLGAPENVVKSTNPVLVTGQVLTGKVIAQLAAGQDHTCVVASGTAICWGRNFHGQVGNGVTGGNVFAPVAVKATTAFKQGTVTLISAGGFSTCATSNGEAYCWGYNIFGQLGDNTTTSRNAPVPVIATGALNGLSVTFLSVGSLHACALATDAVTAKPVCWGENNYGQIGDGTGVNRKVPTAVVTNGALSGKLVTAISSGTSHTCAIANHKAFCWGRNSEGQLGKGDFLHAAVPTTVYAGGVLKDKRILTIDAGSGATAVTWN